MTEIKFRAWLQDEEKIVYSNDQASTDSCEVWIFRDNNLVVQVQETIWREGGGETFERIEYVDCNHTIMQFTGLKDKNRKEIYEGDILSIKPHGANYPIKYVVVFNDKAQFAMRFIDRYNKNEASFYDERLFAEGYSVFEVIGNIYENQDLIK